MYRDMPITERVDRIGELLAKAVYLYAKKEQEEKERGESDEDVVDENSEG